MTTTKANTAARKVTVTQDPNKEVPVEVLARSIVQVAEAATRLLNGPLTRRALVVLIHESIPAGSGYSNNTRPSRTQIEAVLEAAADLKRRYVR